ncbi:MAG: Rab family GTPase [Promethearchaeota archaeon]
MVNERHQIAKVLIAGAPGAGKTSLVHRLVFEGFTEVAPTIGVNFAQKVCRGEAGPVNLSIWDLSGQPRFRCLMPRFCQGATGVVLVVDVTEPDSLDTASQWLEFISSFNSLQQDFAVVLAGNKGDLPGVLTQNRVQLFCARHNIMKYIPCSAKTGENVRLVFDSLCSAMQRNHLAVTEPVSNLAQSPTQRVNFS